MLCGRLGRVLRACKIFANRMISQRVKWYGYTNYNVKQLQFIQW